MIDVQSILQRNDYFESSEHLVDIEGMSTPRVCNLLNHLVREMPKEMFYLEIGTWKGLTLCSAAFENVGKQCVACDKFRFFGKFTGWGYKVRKELFQNLDRYRAKSAHVMFHQMRSEDLFHRRLIPKNVGVYFYDGDHTYQGTYDHLLWSDDYLAKEAIVLVDDWNDPNIRRATADAFESMNRTVTWSSELAGQNGIQSGWWNGLGVFSLEQTEI